MWAGLPYHTHQLPVGCWGRGSSTVWIDQQEKDICGVGYWRWNSPRAHIRTTHVLTLLLISIYAYNIYIYYVRVWYIYICLDAPIKHVSVHLFYTSDTARVYNSTESKCKHTSKAVASYITTCVRCLKTKHMWEWVKIEDLGDHRF